MLKKPLLFLTNRLFVFTKKNKSSLLLIIVLVLGLFLRLYGINWDQGFHLHPDERFLTMAASDLKLPDSLKQYFDTNSSPLNPYNHPNYQFFVYGTFPFFITKAIASINSHDNYQYVHLYGRFLSAIFDSLNILLLFVIFKKIYPKNNRFSLLPSLIYTLLILPLQLSHFFAVDTFLTFFILLTFTLLTYSRFFLGGISFGLALASKISALYFGPIIFMFFIYSILKTNLPQAIGKYLLFGLMSLIIFRIFQPYAFIGFATINPDFVESLKTLSSYSQSGIYFPPQVQWLSQVPIINPLKNIIWFGFGPTILLILVLKLKQANFITLLSLAWIVFLFIYQGSQVVHTMRYFLPAYPFMALLLALVLVQYKRTLLVYCVVIYHFMASLAFLSVYTREHTRIQASRWMYEHIPSSSVISNEHWDDALPLLLPAPSPPTFSSESLPLFDPDTDDKWHSVNLQLSRINYLILSSNRLWGSIPKVPQHYPQTSLFYQNLFDGQTSYVLIKVFNSYPGFHLPFIRSCYYLGPTNYPTRHKANHWFSYESNCSYPGIFFRDDTAEEAFTVYDHPQVLIFNRR